MKKTLLFIAGAMLLTTGINAQITLSQAGYTSSPIGTDSLEATATNPAGVPSLSAATNATWDLSAITDSALEYAYHVNADTSACQFADSDFYSYSGASYQGHVQASIASGGLIDYGVFIPAATQTISGATMNILNQHAVFSSPYTVIQFPATMGNNWSSNYQSDFNFQVTYSPVYSNTPGEVKSFITETDTVVGWGHMRVMVVAGSPSLYFDVLQVKTVTTVMDSFLISGAVPLSAVLTALGVTEGQVTKTYAQNYYRTNEITPFAYVVFTDSTYSTPARVTTHAQRLEDNAVPNVLNNADIQVYPNPVTAHVVSIDVPAATGVWQYELVNVLGQKVAADVLPLSNNQTHTQLQLANTLPAGMYYIRLINGGKQVAVKALEIN